jgi:hypothetical protein
MLTRYSFFILRCAHSQHKTERVTDPVIVASRTPRQIYGQSLLMNIRNPKVTLFFIALLARFEERPRFTSVFPPSGSSYGFTSMGSPVYLRVLSGVAVGE